jgi:hypothetical protein
MICFVSFSSMQVFPWRFGWSAQARHLLSGYPAVVDVAVTITPL